MNNKRKHLITSYGLYVYRHCPESKALPRQWDLDSTVHSRNSALMQGKMLSLRPDVEKVEILRQNCDPENGLCKSKVIKTFRRSRPFWQKPALWISGTLGSLSAVLLVALLL